MVRIPVDTMSMGDRGVLPTAVRTVEKATSAAFGGDVGTALSALGEGGLKLAEKMRLNEQRRLGFEHEDNFVKLMDADNTAYEEKLRGISGAAESWWTGARADTKARLDTWLATLPADARREYQVKADRLLAARTSSAFRDQYRQQDTNTRQTLSEEQRKAGLQVQARPETFDTFVEQQTALIDKSTLPPAEREALKADIKNNLAYTAEMARAKSSPYAVLGANMPAGLEGVKQLLRQKEGFDPGGRGGNAYWDANAWRAGYGSDTITKADGSVVRVKKGDVVSREDAERDLDRRLTTEFIPSAQRAVGNDAWEKLSSASQAVLVSLAYNYGSGAWGRTADGQSKGRLAGVAAAARTGDPAALADAVRALAGDNNGVNAARRNSEADMVLHGRSAGSPASTSSSALTPQQAAAVQEAATRAAAQQDAARTAALQQQQAEQRNALYLDLKEGPAPEASYRAARESGLLRDLPDIQRAETIIRERQKGDDDYAVGLSLMQGGRVPNQFSAAHKAGVDELYSRAVKNGADAGAAALGIFDKTGIVPKEFVTSLRGALASEDKDRLGAALTIGANMLRANPNAFSGVDGGKDIETNATEYRRLTEQIGLDSAAAVDRVLADARDPERLSPVRQEALSAFTKTALTQEKIEARLGSTFGGWFSSAKLPDGPHRVAIAETYAEFAREGFGQFRNESKALAWADHQMQKQFGVQNGVIMRYPPSKSGLPAVAGGHDWISEQAATEASTYLGRPVTTDQVLLLPVERKGVSTRGAINGAPMTVERNDGKPGQRTSFASVPYQIVVVAKTPEDGPLAVPLPGAFFPDVDTYVADKNASAANGAVAYDMIGAAFGVYPHEAPALKTPEQTRRAAEAKLRADHEKARAKRAATADWYANRKDLAAEQAAARPE